MSIASKWAQGKFAWAICDICGVRVRYKDLKYPTSMGYALGLAVCPTCYDPDHPQNFLPKMLRVDAEALKGARPDTGLAASRREKHWWPVDSIPLVVTVGDVEVIT